MTITTFQKSDFTWYGISILQSKNGYDIYLLFKDLNDGHKFFNMVTKDNKRPSFYCILQPDKTHTFKIDYSSRNNQDDYVAVSSKLTLENYPPLEWLKENKKFKIIIGTEGIVNGLKQTMGTDMDFTPDKVEYLSEPEQLRPGQVSLN